MSGRGCSAEGFLASGDSPPPAKMVADHDFDTPFWEKCMCESHTDDDSDGDPTLFPVARDAVGGQHEVLGEDDAAGRSEAEEDGNDGEENGGEEPRSRICRLEVDLLASASGK